MDVDKIVAYWLTTSAEDFKVMEHLFEKGDYAHALFFAHLAIEKALKALYCKTKKDHAPHKHNLLNLARLIDLSITEEQELWLEEVNRFNLEARYPDFKLNFYKICTRDFTLGHINKTEEFIPWISNKL